jgi:diguanylate cyclase (GGDEF)-like protein
MGPLSLGTPSAPQTGTSPVEARDVPRGGVRLAISTMFSILCVVFVVEFFVMVALAYFGHAPGGVSIVVLDAALLAILSSPIIYLLVLRPIRREQETRVRAERKAETFGQLAKTDWLTQLMNRRGIEATLLEAMAVSERYRRELTVAMVDLDRFKAVNDLYGHETGDRVLRQLGRILAGAVRAPDRVGRYGGEEFLLVSPETGLDAAQNLLERIRRLVQESDFVIRSKRVEITVSIGVTEFRPGESLRHLVSRVDAALYEAKNAGRNRVRSRSREAELRLEKAPSYSIVDGGGGRGVQSDKPMAGVDNS